ncbi:hypothetical protein HPB51_022622 [Rhipicephalus microplus]|uniref:Uncharacterized protein n=1 Tax=Rhipicephalus microplus TaxID=6941 RepID=A0A9J6EUZ8_RHIMP|nr:hypothetical protein HPB51_022622 [Rhipicephalus microplus]
MASDTPLISPLARRLCNERSRTWLYGLGRSYGSHAACQPAYAAENVRVYAYVVEGVVSSLRHMHRRDVTEIMVSASRVHRDSIEEPAFLPGNDRKMAAVLQRPLKCGTRAGRGHFLFIGVRMLGKPTMRCAPRLQYWRKLRDRAIKDGTSMCTLL